MNSMHPNLIEKILWIIFCIEFFAAAIIIIVIKYKDVMTKRRAWTDTVALETLKTIRAFVYEDLPQITMTRSEFEKLPHHSEFVPSCPHGTLFNYSPVFAGYPAIGRVCHSGNEICITRFRVNLLP